MKLKLFLIASSLVIIAFITFAIFSNPPSHSVMNELRAEGDVIIEKIEEYKNSNKNYPASLSVISTGSDKSHYGGWKYTLENNGKTFVLSIGDYGEYLFEMYWDSNSGEWYLDR
jgi:hypothetical protein